MKCFFAKALQNALLHPAYAATAGMPLPYPDVRFPPIPDGLVTALAINTTRDCFCRTRFETDYNLGTMYD